MHQGLPRWVYKVVPPLETLVYEHRKLHHQKYYHRFDHEDDPYGKEVNLRLGWEHTLLAVAFFVPYLFVTTIYLSLVPVIVIIICAEVHAVLWNMIHVEMHQPKHPWWSRSGIYRFLGRHHYLHHQDTHTGFNIVFPFFDYVMGTFYSPSDEQKTELKRLGFLSE
jgi:hypothetical protein